MKYKPILKLLILPALAATASMPVHATDIWYDLSSPTGNQGDSHVYGAGMFSLPISGWMTASAPWVASNLRSGSWDPLSATATGVFGKFEGVGSDETGLGMTSDPNSGQHEIWAQKTAPQPGSGALQFGFVSLDVRGIEANYPLLKYLQLEIGSSQPHEYFTIWGSNNQSTGNATFLEAGVGTAQNGQVGPFNAPNSWNTFDYLWVGAVIDPNHPSITDHSNVLLDAFVGFKDSPPIIPPGPPGTVPEPGSFVLAGSGLLAALLFLRKRR